MIGTAIAALVGIVSVICGLVVSAAAPLVKVQTKLATNVLPARSATPVVIVAVNSVFGAKAAAGVKVAVLAMEA